MCVEDERVGRRLEVWAHRGGGGGQALSAPTRGPAALVDRAVSGPIGKRAGPGGNGRAPDGHAYVGGERGIRNRRTPQSRGPRSGRRSGPTRRTRRGRSSTGGRCRTRRAGRRAGS